jgi:hypothetical protein
VYQLPTKRVYAAVPDDAFEAVCDLSLRERRAAKDTAGLLIEEALNARGLLQRENAQRADRAALAANK